MQFRLKLQDVFWLVKFSLLVMHPDDRGLTHGSCPTRSSIEGSSYPLRFVPSPLGSTGPLA